VAICIKLLPPGGWLVGAIEQQTDPDASSVNIYFGVVGQPGGVSSRIVGGPDRWSNFEANTAAWVRRSMPSLASKRDT
jgi:hypothetical protein